MPRPRLAPHLHLTSSCGWHHYDAILQVGRERHGPRLTQRLCWAQKPGLHPWQQRPRSLLAPEPEINAQSEYKRQLPGGLQAWRGPKLTLPVTEPPPTQGRLEGVRLSGPGSRGVPRRSRHSLWARSCHLPAPASSGLKARLEAAVTPTLPKFSAPYLFFLEQDLTCLLPMGWEMLSKALPFTWPHFPCLGNEAGGRGSRGWGVSQGSPPTLTGWGVPIGSTAQ